MLLNAELGFTSFPVWTYFCAIVTYTNEFVDLAVLLY